jgi:hypothetical protein
MLARVKYESRNIVNNATKRINSLSPVFFIFVAFCLAAFGFGLTYHFQTTIVEPFHQTSVLAATWNMAAINNNPFEYWITYDKDKSYETIMQEVSKFINNPGDLDVTVETLFTDAMFNQLLQQMETVSKWGNLDKIKDIWNNDYKKRKIISQYLTDATLGKKRLTSMPDRITNTISDGTLGGKVLMRPTVINCYKGKDLGNFESWWSEWLLFMFDTNVTSEKDGKSVKIWQLLSPITHAKYPSITQEEEAISIQLQTLACAIFDSILIHMMNHIAPTRWQPLRQEMCESLNLKKNEISASILSDIYSEYDILFLQEVSKAFVQLASAGGLLSDTVGALRSSLLSSSSNSGVTPPSPIYHNTLNRHYHIHTPISMATGTNSRDQNSVIMLKKHRYKDVKDVTDEIMKEISASNANGNIKKPIPVADGDLLVLSVYDNATGYKYLLASFHGDTNGLATIPVLNAVYSHAINKRPDHRLLFGMDANTYEFPGKDLQDVESFAEFYTSKKLNSCYGRKPNPKNYTTFHARTYLQSQLNKAVSLEDRDKKGDKNPKDFIIFFDSDFSTLWTRKDNTGQHLFIDNMIYPTLTFPSDHAITSTLLIERKVITTSDSPISTSNNANIKKFENEK